MSQVLSCGHGLLSFPLVSHQRCKMRISFREKTTQVRFEIAQQFGEIGFQKKKLVSLFLVPPFRRSAVPPFHRSPVTGFTNNHFGLKFLVSAFFIILVPKVFFWFSKMGGGGGGCWREDPGTQQNHVTDLCTKSVNLFKMAAKSRRERTWVRDLQAGEKQAKWWHRRTRCA